MHRSILVGGVALVAAIFVIDALLPLPYDIGTLYVLAIVLGLWVKSPRYPLLAAALATVLLIADTVIGWDGTPAPSIYANRPLTTLLFWVTAALVVRFRQLEEKSAAQVTRLEELTNALDQAAIVATTDVTGRITYVNDKFCEISKYAREELIGQDHRIINSGLHPKEYMRHLWRTIAGGKVWHGEIRNRAKDGMFYWVDTTIVPFLKADGKPYQYVAIRHDITERKLAEERLRYQESLARVGQLAAMVAHEVKNPLAGIKGVLQVLMSRRPAGHPESDVMHEIIDRIDALNELISDLLVFARQRPPKLQPLELRPLLTEAIDLVRKDPIGEHVTAEIEGPDVALTGDSTMLRSVFSNLVINAAQARSVELHGGTVTVVCPPEGGTRVAVTLPLQPAIAAAVPA